MTRILNHPDDFVEEALEGFVSANRSLVRRVRGGVVRRNGPDREKVAVVIGGGSGHYPAFAGLVGKGLAAGAVCGNLFASPSSSQVGQVVAAANGGGGVLLSYGNYAGDVLHFGLAEKELRAAGIDVRTVLVTDDIASATDRDRSKRRGIAGDFVVFKVAGAAAERGYSLDDVEHLARRANDRTRTLGVAFGGCTVPGATAPLFTVPSGMMSVGLGIHGEPGVADQPIPTARELASVLVHRLLDELPEDIDAPQDHRVALVVNGLGTVKYEELFVLFREVELLLTSVGVTVVEPECGELVTSLDMSGVSVTLFWLDAQLEGLWTDAAESPAYKKGKRGGAIDGGRNDREVDPIDAQNPIDDGVDIQSASVPLVRAAPVALRLLRAAHDQIESDAAYLGELDSFAGDGDHGRGMSTGLSAACSAAAGIVERGGGVAQVLVEAGKAWSDRAGGTSGALWGAALEAAGRRIGGRGSVNARAIADAVSAALAAVRALGKAEPGDKTMVDAFVPFERALSYRVDAGLPIRRAWTEAAAIAHDAAQNTAILRPKLGRARPLAERSVGHPDPGAVSFALILRSAVVPRQK